MNLVQFLTKIKGIQPPLADKYGDWLGYEIESMDEKAAIVKTHLKVREDHLSPSGAVHGGVISGFFDFSCGCAVFLTLEPKQLCSTVELNVKYFRPVKAGDEIVAEAKVLHRGRTLCSVVATIYKKGETEKVVAMATGTFNIYLPKF